MLNAATTMKCFGRARESIPVFSHVARVYSSKLDPMDYRFAGLYNNMALTLTDLSHFSDARGLYEKALGILASPEDAPEAAITYLNLASLTEAEKGLEEGEAEIAAFCRNARELLESYPHRDGNYAFVCEKCASVYGYYGFTDYANTLSERSRRIYEGT